MFSDFLATLAAAGSSSTISKTRIAIADAAANGKLSQAAAEALEAVSRVAAEHIAAHGEKPERPVAPRTPAPAKPAGARHHAVIRSVKFSSFSDSGDSWRGVAAVDTHGDIQFRVPADGGPRSKAFLRAIGADANTEAGDMISRTCLVEVSPWQFQDGERLVISRWHPEEAPAAAPAAPRGPRKTVASKIQGGGGLDEPMF